jgi:hypothetical protein
VKLTQTFNLNEFLMHTESTWNEFQHMLRHRKNYFEGRSIKNKNEFCRTLSQILASNETTLNGFQRSLSQRGKNFRAHLVNIKILNFE